MRLPIHKSANQLVLRCAAGLLAPGLVMIVGCAGGVSASVANPANAALSITSSSSTANTNGQIQLKAVTPSGSSAAVKWTLVRGENDSAIGQGAIDSHGVYIPPASLTRDSIEVEVQAQLRSDPTKIATQIVTVTPGFLQPLTPENSTLAAGGTLQVTAQLAEVGSGSIDWSLATSANGGRKLGSGYGAFSQESCQHSPENYTVCSAVYTAPLNLPTGGRDLYVIATVNSNTGNARGDIHTRAPLHILLNGSGVSSSPLTNQAEQTSLIQLGSSGGNNNDADISKDSAGKSFINDCCGGTLGALVRDQTGTQYILSNNHVLAESDQAALGDNIVQPGLIDRNCDQNAGRPVASLRYVVPLATAQTNVDAALAEVNGNSIDPSGAILHLGLPGSGLNGGTGAAAPAAGIGQPISPGLFSPDSAPLRVAKSGRTTGLTCSTIDAIDLSIEVDYYKDCAETQPYYRKTFANQIGIGGDGFSDSGDSGALIVNASNAQPLGLYFAGGTDNHGGGFSVASPIQDVLGELSTQAGKQFSVVGGAEHPVSCLNYDAKGADLPEVADSVKRKAESAVRRNAPSLINPVIGILDLAVGSSVDFPGDAAVIVYVDKSKENVPVPQTIGGLRTITIATDEASIASGSAPKTVEFVGGIHLTESVLQSAGSVQQAYTKRLLADPAIFGVGVTQSRDNPAEAALLLLVDMSQSPRSLPATIGGLRTRYVALNRFHVTRSKHAGAPHPSSCALKSLAVEGKTETFHPERMAPLSLR